MNASVVTVKEIRATYINRRLKKLVNVYQYDETKAYPPVGYGDFLRGCIFLTQFCKIVGLEFSPNIANHPISKFIQEVDTLEEGIYVNYIYSCYITTYVKNSMSYFVRDFIAYLNRLGDEVEVHYIACNSSPMFPTTDDVRAALLPKMRPTPFLMERVSAVGLWPKTYTVLQIRAGDRLLVGGHKLESPMVERVINTLRPILGGHPTTYFLISDSAELKVEITKIYPFIRCCHTDITHLGGFTKISDSATINTLVDFYVMANAAAVISMSFYDHGSGFSKWCCDLHNVPYRSLIINRAAVRKKIL
jgi:hypothetical protein